MHDPQHTMQSAHDESPRHEGGGVDVQDVARETCKM